MSFPYHQYVDYSNPATPRVYAWDVPSATPTSESGPTLQLAQDHQLFAPQQQQHEEMQQHQQISPSQLQLHQLPPTVPAQQQHEHQHSLSPQEHTSQLQYQQRQEAHVQQQHQQQQQFNSLPVPHTIQVVPTRPAPAQPQQPQYRFETVTEEDFIHARAPGTSRRRGASKPPLHVETSRASSASAVKSGSPPSALELSSAGAGAAGPLRIPHARAHVQTAHPYRRPQSRAASTSGSAAIAAAATSVRSRRVSAHEFQSADTPQTSTGAGVGVASGSGTSGRGAALPTVGTVMGVSCPASSAWREGLLGLSTTPASGFAGTSFDPDAILHGHVLPMSVEPVKRYGIRADIHFDEGENVITAMFELPGVKRSDVRITMSVCPFSRVRQVSISGQTRSALPVQGHSVRERKYGDFFRTMVVPPETRPEDIVVSLEDGVLTLKIPGGAPAQAEQPEDIPIP